MEMSKDFSAGKNEREKKKRGERERKRGERERERESTACSLLEGRSACYVVLLECLKGLDLVPVVVDELRSGRQVLCRRHHIMSGRGKQPCIAPAGVHPGQTLAPLSTRAYACVYARASSVPHPSWRMPSGAGHGAFRAAGQLSSCPNVERTMP